MQKEAQILQEFEKIIAKIRKQLDAILNDIVFFKDQVVPYNWDEPGQMEYQFVALSREQKSLIVASADEIKSLLSQIVGELSGGGEFGKFLQICTNGTFLDRYKAALTRRVPSEIGRATGPGAGDHIGRILKNDGRVEEKHLYLQDITFDVFLTNLNNIKNYYIDSINKIRNFSFEEISKYTGYSSVEEFAEYYKLYLELKAIPEYLKYFEKSDHPDTVKYDDSNIKGLIKNIFDFLFINERITLDYNFFKLGKKAIDDFKNWANSTRINYQTALLPSQDNSYFYLDRERGIRGGSFWNKVKDLITEYYYKWPTSPSEGRTFLMRMGFIILIII